MCIGHISPLELWGDLLKWTWSNKDSRDGHENGESCYLDVIKGVLMIYLIWNCWKEERNGHWDDA